MHTPTYMLYEEMCMYIISDVMTSSPARRYIYISEPEKLTDMTNSSAGTGAIPSLDTSHWSPVNVTSVTLRHSTSMAMTDENFNFRNFLHAAILTRRNCKC